MREAVFEHAAKGASPEGPAVAHYEALALLAAVALVVLGLVMAVDRLRKRRR